MVSKNNRIKRLEEVAGRQSHFGIRKLTVGAASVLLGITLLFGANAKVARADGTDGAGAANSVNGSTDEVVDPAEGRTPEQQGENPAAPSKATDEEATAYKNLKSAIEQARNTKGLTVSGPYDSKPGDNACISDELGKSKVGVIYDNETLSAEDMQKQADEIQKKIKDYVENRSKFIQGLKEQGIYKDGDVDPTTLAQHLILQSEPQAKSEYKIQDNNGKWTTDKENGVVTVTRDPNAPFVNDPNNPSVNPAYAVHLKNNNQVTGPIIQITYTNLKNSEYDGKPLGKIVETFSDVHATDINDSKAAFYISTNPTNGWLYTDCDGVTATIQLYDNQDDPQPIKIDSSAYVSVSSLNSNGLTFTSNGETIIKGRTEAAQLLSKGSAMSIPESSVQVFPGNKVLSPSDNEDLLYNKTHNKDQINYWGKFFAPREADWNKLYPDQQEDEIQKVGNYVINNYSDWDNTGSRKIFGSALYKVEENPIVIRSYVIRNSSNPIRGYWFTYSTTVPQTSFDAINTINYHFATAHATSQVFNTQDSTRNITYVNRQGNTEVAPHKDQKITFTGTATIDNSTGKIVKVDKTGVITQVGNGKVDDINNYGNWTWETNDGAIKSGKGDSAEINDVTSPTIKDMHVVNVSTDATKDGKNVDRTTLKRGNSYNVVVTYDDDTEVVNEKKDVTRKIHYTGAGEATPKDPDPEKVHFTATGIRDKRTGEFVKLDEDHHIVLDKDGKVVPGTLTWVGPNREKDTGSWAGKPSPVVNGYHIKGVDRDSKNGIDVDLVDNFNHKKVGYTVTVIYEPNGHIIPVDPNGKKIPNVDHPQYPTDPTDPTKVKPDTPIPKITGWHIAKNPDPGKTPGTVTPKDPTKDTLVIFAKDQYAQIIYRDVNDPKNIITLDMSPEVTGTAGDPITFGDKDNPTNKITGYKDKGYVLVNDKFDSGKPIFDSNDGIQIFNIDFKHGTTPVTPDKPQKPDDPINPNDPDGPKWPKGTTADDLTRKATQTITYKYSDGSKPDTTKVENQDKAFTKTVTVDNVTGKIIKQTDWTPAGYKFNPVDTPRVDGYHADKKQAGGRTATPDHPDVNDTVVYTPNGHIIPVDPDGNPIPGIPEEPYVTDPNDPTKVVPDENVPKDPNGKYTPDKDTVTPEDPSQDTPVVYNPIPNVPGPSVGPSDNTPTPVTPTPGKTTEEKKPEETKPDETKPDENKDDKDVDEPDDDEDVVPTPRHHKKHNGGESSTTRSRPTGYTPAPKGSGYLDANGKVHYKLPQTGESDSEEMVAVLGGAAVAIGLIGLAGAKKRRHE
ncbi:mucin-binding protein [Lactobacillus gallinarum]|uniref:Gram-positive cocci surface proteins LPxTG domain-containing protein n=1 Tax=Lactobacillus gallinarum TaxID=52242 RepID=A0A1Y4W592_9LACO|nr:YSIRK-type signal peptide-containing protein [Lactobacillus gallinarum]OUQ57883.1 hypothetical protein B5E59_01680 [Lactobacillus gallinarum]OUQ77567.1 hypothetical protein B5E44_01620 [Lactobacillus gallinarum]